TSHEAECRPFLIPVSATRKAQPGNKGVAVDELVAWNTGGGPGGGPDLIVDDGGDATLLIHEGVKAEEEFAKTGKVPYPSSTDNAEFQIMLNIFKEGLSVDPLKYHNMKERLVGASEETTTGVMRLYQMQANEPVSLGRGDLINDNAPKKPMDRATAGPILLGDIITDDLIIDNVTEKPEEKIEHPSCIRNRKFSSGSGGRGGGCYGGYRRRDNYRDGGPDRNSHGGNRSRPY
ncbi:S-adenosyl-L-homocysteine hydrolase, partial [Tanacetum coccineum]